MAERFQVRDATSPSWNWLPDWVVVDTEKKVRVAAYDDKDAALADCDERNDSLATTIDSGEGE